ncbi:MAG: type II secretion system protein [Calothrix sp. SM1_5_4]|nr:type II secretion system protein [Calothrix sp. SM1_5_4]
MEVKEAYLERGGSLIEVLVMLGVIGVVALAMMNLLQAQHQQIRVLSQKQEIIDFKNLVLQNALRPEVCSWQLKSTGATLDLSAATSETHPSASVINLPALYQGVDVNSAKLAEVGNTLPGSLTGMVVQSIQFKGVYATGNPNEYRGFLEVVFEPASLAMIHKPVRVSQIVRVMPGDPINAKRVETCLGHGLGAATVTSFAGASVP